MSILNTDPLLIGSLITICLIFLIKKGDIYMCVYVCVCICVCVLGWPVSLFSFFCKMGLVMLTCL